MQLDNEDGAFKMYLDGSRLFDDDVCDEALMMDKTVVLSKSGPKTPDSQQVILIPKSEPITPVTSKLQHSYSDDTTSVHSDSSRPVTPMSDVDEKKDVNLPRFSNALNHGLTETEYKPCPNDLWKKVTRHMQSVFEC